MRHLWSQVWIALRWFWSFREAVAGSLSEVKIAVSSAKVAVVVAGEICSKKLWWSIHRVEL
jgi:hypothetical protein